MITVWDESTYLFCHPKCRFTLCRCRWSITNENICACSSNALDGSSNLDWKVVRLTFLYRPSTLVLGWLLENICACPLTPRWLLEERFKKKLQRTIIKEIIQLRFIVFLEQLLCSTQKLSSALWLPSWPLQIFFNQPDITRDKNSTELIYRMSKKEF